MSSPLDGCWAKIERADENIANLKAEVATFVHPDNYPVIRKIDRETRECILTVVGKPIPLRFSVLAGEIVHHLRSSLDHLIWAMVLQRHPAPDFQVQFPVCLTPKDFERSRKKGIMKGVTLNAQMIIESLQPYQNVSFGCSAVDDPLRILHEFDIADKHTLLTVAVSAAALQNKIHFSGRIADTQIERFIPHHWADHLLRTEPEGTEILTIRFSKMHPELKVHAEFRYQVAFEHFGTREIEPIIPSLTDLRDYVVKTIKLFSGEF